MRTTALGRPRRTFNKNVFYFVDETTIRLALFLRFLGTVIRDDGRSSGSIDVFVVTGLALMM